MSVEEAARALVAKLDACYAAWLKGEGQPDFLEELEALRAALEHKED